MNAEQWARVTELLGDVLEEPSREAEILRNETETIQAEVRRLRAAHLEAERNHGGTATQRRRVVGERYELMRLLGTGGSGEAWLSQDLETGESVVVKMPLHWEWYREDLHRRFLAEVEILRRLRHPGIVSMLGAGKTAEGTPFFVMPFVEGESLRAVLERGPVGREEAAAIVEQLGEAIAAAHAESVIHRDIKPENVMVQRRGDGGVRAVLIDFGISLFADGETGAGTTTKFFGTTRYMAPEQLLGKPVKASDVYALALIVYEMVTGRALFAGETPVALYEEQRKFGGGSFGPDVAFGLREVLGKGLRAEAAKRPEVGEFARGAAAEIREPRGWRPSRRWLLMAAGVVGPVAGWVAYDRRPLSAEERRVEYQAGQTYRDVGWRLMGTVDTDVTVFDATRTKVMGNRLVSRDQGSYVYPLAGRVKRFGLARRWRIVADILPVHGDSNFGVCFAEVGVRFVATAVAPDRGDSYVFLTETYRPSITGKRKAAQFAKDRMTRFEMVFDPGSGTARLSADGVVLVEGYRGTHEYLESPGVGIGFGAYESAMGEGVFGDFRFEMD
ncbi:MAG: serine/threonine protein kinase [Acidobacteria bacterium]|nr:serine/threonine protein kinase [Acidobacteriota bacterium]